MEPQVGTTYRSVRGRLTDLLTEETARRPDAWDVPVSACPGWRVRDVLAHLVGILEDGRAGRLSGPPGPEQTAEQVDRHRDDDPAGLLVTWAALAELSEEFFTRVGAWPAAIDALSHEHDVRHALGVPGAREHEDVRAVAEVLLPSPDQPYAVVLDGRTATDARPTLSTDPFTWVRVRMGRRSRDEVLALDWSADPSAVLPAVFVFGPRETPLGEQSPP